MTGAGEGQRGEGGGGGSLAHLSGDTDRLGAADGRGFSPVVAAPVSDGVKLSPGQPASCTAHTVILAICPILGNHRDDRRKATSRRPLSNIQCRPPLTRSLFAAAHLVLIRRPSCGGYPLNQNHSRCHCLRADSFHFGS